MYIFFILFYLFFYFFFFLRTYGISVKNAGDCLQHSVNLFCVRDSFMAFKLTALLENSFTQVSD